MSPQQISVLIDNSPINHGVNGMEWLRDPDNLAIVEGETIGLFSREGRGMMEFHWLVSPKGKAAVIQTLRAMVKAFEANPDINTIFGLIHESRPDSAMMARWIGAKFRGKRETDEGAFDYFTISRASAMQQLRKKQ